MNNHKPSELSPINKINTISFKRLRHLLYAVVLIAFDQFTKYLSRVEFSDGSDVTVIPGVLRFVLHKNTGAVWGFLSGTEHSILYLTIATIVILTLIIYVYFKIPDTKKFVPLLLIITFIFSGAIGNLIDRVILNYVTDFIYFEIINFPVFNVADCYVTVSVFILSYLILFKYNDSDLDFFSKKKQISETE